MDAAIEIHTEPMDIRPLITIIPEECEVDMVRTDHYASDDINPRSRFLAPWLRYTPRPITIYTNAEIAFATDSVIDGLDGIDSASLAINGVVQPERMRVHALRLDTQMGGGFIGRISLSATEHRIWPRIPDIEPNEMDEGDLLFRVQNMIRERDLRDTRDYEGYDE